MRLRFIPDMLDGFSNSLFLRVIKRNRNRKKGKRKRKTEKENGKGNIKKEKR